MYSIIFDKQAANFFRKLDRDIQERIGKKIESLASNPEMGKSLVGKLSGLWSLRIGDYRAIYKIKNKELIILILKLGHRKNVYE